MTNEKLQYIQTLLLDKARLQRNDDTGIFAYHTYSKEQADKCLKCILEGREKGFKIRDNRIYFGVFDEISKDYFEGCRSFIFDSGISDKIPFQSGQSYGSSPYMAYMSTAFYNGEISNRHTSISDWHIFVLLLRKPVDAAEMTTLANADHMSLKTAFRGKSNGLCMSMLTGGDGYQECTYIFDCLAIHCHDIHFPSLIPNRSLVVRSAGSAYDMIDFLG